MKRQMHGLVLAGGRSSRMGLDKASLVIGDDKLTQTGHALGLLRQFCAQTYLSLRDGQDVPPGAKGATVLRDETSTEGPMAGLLAAFREAPGAAWMVLACDLPFIRSDLLARLLAVHDKQPNVPFVAFADATSGLPEPLCAIYGPSAGAILARHAARGQFSPRRIMIEDSALLLELEDTAALSNMNTPQDLSAARVKASPR